MLPNHKEARLASPPPAPAEAGSRWGRCHPLVNSGIASVCAARSRSRRRPVAPLPRPRLLWRLGARCVAVSALRRLAARRPSRRLRRAPPLAGSSLRPSARGSPAPRRLWRPCLRLRSSLAAGLPRGSVPPPLLPSGGLSPRPSGGARGVAFRAPPREFRACGRGGTGYVLYYRLYASPQAKPAPWRSRAARVLRRRRRRQ